MASTTKGAKESTTLFVSYMLVAMGITGLLDVSSWAADGDIKWTFEINQVDGDPTSPAIGIDGTVYIGTENYRFYALNPDGTEKWSFPEGGEVTIASDGTIYTFKNNKLYALYPSSGAEKWSFQAGDSLGKPVIGHDGTLYLCVRFHLGPGDIWTGKIYALDPVNGTERWSTDQLYDGYLGPLSVGPDGTIYAGMDDHNAENDGLYAIDPNGVLKWVFKAEGEIESPAAIGQDGTIYVGANKLFAIYPNGTEKWSYSGSGDWFCGIAIGTDETIYSGSGDHRLYAVYPNGTLKWSFVCDGPVEDAPAVGYDGIIYKGCDDGQGTIYAINMDGTLRWSFPSGSQDVSSAAIAPDGTVYFGTDGDTQNSVFYAFETSSIGLASSSWPMLYHDAMHSGRFSAFAKYGGGTGKANDPYLIYTAEHMNELGTNSKDWDKHFKLMADIDLSAFTGVDFNIIGYWKSYADNHPFTGLFDGNGRKIKNLAIAAQHQDDVGLFGCLGIGGEIKNLGFEDVNIEIIDPGFEGATFYSVNGHNIAGLVAWNVFGTITNCHVSGVIKGGRIVGGLVGRNCGIIHNCYSTANIFGEDEVGGLVGWNDFGLINNCHATGGINGDNRVGGLVGQNFGQITNCYSSASIIGRENTIGGLVGENEFNGMITKCYSTGSVEAWSQSEEVGGLAGENSSTITNCYTACTVLGGDYVGGIVGWNDDNSMVTHCYAVGSINGNNVVGGLVGYNDGGADVLVSFWDTQTTNQADGIGFDEGGGTINIFGLITADMMQQATFTDEGWDFVDEIENGIEDIWWMPEDGYPKLWWELGDGASP